MSYLLLAITLIIGILQGDNLFSKPLKIKSWVIVGLLIISTIFSFISEYQKGEDEKYSSETGVLDGEKTEGKELIWHLSGARVKFPNGRFQLRDLGNYFVYGNKEKADSILNIIKGVELEAHIEDNRLMVNTTIRDISGNIIAEIINNNWKVNSKPIVWDKNFDDHALEVKNNEGQVVLQVEIQKNIIKLKGIFIRPDGSVVVVQGFELPELGKDVEIPILLVADPISAKKAIKHKEMILIKPMFKYPSAFNKSQRINMN